MSAIVTYQPRYSLSRKARLLRTAALLALLITLVNLFAQFVSGASAASSSVSHSVATADIRYVSVRSGDTLWSLAQAYAPTQDPRDWINQVVTINNLQGIDLVAGQRLAIPAN